jgi:hypothetical protein
MFYKAIDGEAFQGQNSLKRVKFFKESPQIKPLPHPQLEEILEASPRISKKPQGPVKKAFPDRVVFAANTGIDFHLHLFRRFFTSSFLEMSVHFMTIDSPQGNTKIKTILIYSHADKEKKKKAVDWLI